MQSPQLAQLLESPYGRPPLLLELGGLSHVGIDSTCPTYALSIDTFKRYLNVWRALYLTCVYWKILNRLQTWVCLSRKLLKKTWCGIFYRSLLLFPVKCPLISFFLWVQFEATLEIYHGPHILSSVSCFHSNSMVRIPPKLGDTTCNTFDSH